MHTLCCNPVSTPPPGNYSPGALVFNRNMFLNIPLLIDILTLTRNRQAPIDYHLLEINRPCRLHEYKVSMIMFSWTYPTETVNLILSAKVLFQLFKSIPITQSLYNVVQFKNWLVSVKSSPINRHDISLCGRMSQFASSAHNLTLRLRIFTSPSAGLLNLPPALQTFIWPSGHSYGPLGTQLVFQFVIQRQASQLSWIK